MVDMFKKKHGFTLVEILVVVIVIVILAVIAGFAYTGYQAQSRNSARSAQAHIIADSLEKYYDKNGEYPSVAAIVQPQPGSIVQSKLKLSNPKVLILPGSTPETTNSLTQSDSSPSQLAYNGGSESPDEQDQCENDPNGGCDSFDLQWLNENGDTQEIQSNHRGRSTLSNQQGTPPSAPDAPNISVTYTSPNIVATATAVTCEAGSTAEYKILGTTNTDGSDPNFPDWSTVSWQSGLTTTMDPTQGTYYYFKAIAHCVNSAGPSDDSDESDIANYFYAAAGTPVVTATITGTTVYVSIAPVTCPTGSTAKYQLYERKDTPSATGSFAVVSTMNFVTTTNYTGTAGATSAPTKNWYKAYTRCDTSTAQGSVSPSSATVSVVSAPVAPTLTSVPAGTSGTSNSVTWNWSLPATACPVGTTITYNRIWTGDYTNKGSGATGTTTSIALTTSSQGYQYGMQVRASCGNPVTNQVLQSAYSANNTYVRTIDSVVWVYKGSIRTRRPDASGHPNTVFGQSIVHSTRNVDYNGGWNTTTRNAAYPPVGGCASGLTRKIQWQWSLDNKGWGYNDTSGAVDNGAWSPAAAWADGTDKVLPAGSTIADFTGIGMRDLDKNANYTTTVGSTSKVAIRYKTWCENASTSRTGSSNVSDPFGNLTVLENDGRFHTYCDPTADVPWCRAWHTPYNPLSDHQGVWAAHDGSSGTCKGPSGYPNDQFCFTPIYTSNSAPWGW